MGWREDGWAGGRKGGVLRDVRTMMDLLRKWMMAHVTTWVLGGGGGDDEKGNKPPPKKNPLIIAFFLLLSFRLRSFSRLCMNEYVVLYSLSLSLFLLLFFLSLSPSLSHISKNPNPPSPTLSLPSSHTLKTSFANAV